MELNITNETQNPLFTRKEIIATTNAKSAPQRQEVIQALAKKYSAPLEAIRVLTIKGSFGTDEFTINANVYPSKEERDKYEKLSKKEQDVEAKLTAPKEEPKEETAPEAPVEESKKEEAPVEEKAPEAPVEEKASPDVPSEEGKENKTEEAK